MSAGTNDKWDINIDPRTSRPKAEDEVARFRQMMYDHMQFSLAPSMISVDAKDFFIDPRRKPTHWTTLDGRTLKITEMKADHLENCIKHLDNRIKLHTERGELDRIDELAEIQKVMRKELKSRGFTRPINMEITT